MSAEILLILGCVSLSSFVAYAWWSALRVWFLRQDLFAIRDELWDTMRARGTLDLSAHRECRQSINAMIRVAPFLSPLTVFRLFTVEVRHVEPDPATMPDEVLRARERVFRRVTRYLLFESATGLLITAHVVSTMSMRVAKDWGAEIVQGIFDSDEIRSLASTASKYRVAS